VTRLCYGIGIGANRWHLQQPSNGAAYSAVLYAIHNKQSAYNIMFYKCYYILFDNVVLSVFPFREAGKPTRDTLQIEDI